MAEISDVIKMEPPDFGYELWDGSSLSDVVKTKFNVILSIRQCQRLLRPLDSSLARPKTSPAGGNQNG